MCVSNTSRIELQVTCFWCLCCLDMSTVVVKVFHELAAMQVTPGEVMPIYSDREFDYVLKKHADQLVVVCASSTDCKPCRSFEPVYDVSSSFVSIYHSAICSPVL